MSNLTEQEQEHRKWNFVYRLPAQTPTKFMGDVLVDVKYIMQARSEFLDKLHALQAHLAKLDSSIEHALRPYDEATIEQAKIDIKK